MSADCPVYPKADSGTRFYECSAQPHPRSTPRQAFRGHALTAGESKQQPADQSRAADQRSNVIHQAGRGEREQGKCGQAEIDGKDVRDDLAHTKSAVDGALIKMRAVRLPDWLAVHESADQRDGGV